MMPIPQINTMKNFDEVTVPEGKYFVIGDKRDNSKDTRYFGFVERKQIIGKATMVIFFTGQTAYVSAKDFKIF